MIPSVQVLWSRLGRGLGRLAPQQGERLLAADRDDTLQIRNITSAALLLTSRQEITKQVPGVITHIIILVMVSHYAVSQNVKSHHATPQCDHTMLYHTM